MSDKPLPFEKLKSSKLLGKEFFDEELDSVSGKEIDELVTLLEMARVSTLVICVCNPPVLRKKILDALKERLSDFDVGIYDVSITEEDEHVVKLLMGIEQSEKFRRYEKKYRSVVLSVVGTENIFKAKDELKISRFYQNLNLYRDYFVQSKHPTLLWVNEAIASDVTIKAPDFWRARTKVAIFGFREEMVAKDIMQISELPEYYRDLVDIKRRDKIHERLLKSLDPSRPADRIPYAALSLGLGMLKDAQGLYDEAEELCKKSLELAGEVNDKGLMSLCLYQLGMVRQRRGNYDKAEELYQQSLKIKRELGDKYGIGATLHQLATIEELRGNYDKAEELYQQNLKLFKRELGDKYGIGATLHQLAMIEELRGNYDKAEELYQQSLNIKRELGDKYGIALGMGALGVLLSEMRRFEDAFKHSLEAAYLLHELGLPREKRALRDMAITAKKLSKEKVNKIFEEAPEEVKTYLKQLIQKTEK